MGTVLVTGANRGLGLALAREYAQAGWRVIATCRNPAAAGGLRSLGAEMHTLELTDTAAIDALGHTLAGETIDVLIANAGVLLDDDPSRGVLDEAAWLESFRVNTMAPVALARALVKCVERSAERKMIAIGIIVGSITASSRGGYDPYRASKAALNAVWRAFAIEHRGIVAAVLHPGRLRTDMMSAAPPGELTPPEERAAQLRETIARLGPAESGGFFNYAGKPLPW